MWLQPAHCVDRSPQATNATVDRFPCSSNAKMRISLYAAPFQLVDIRIPQTRVVVARRSPYRPQISWTQLVPYRFLFILFASLLVCAHKAKMSLAAETLPSPATLDFQRRCSNPGVIKCVGFDKPEDISGHYGLASGIQIGASAPALDTEIKASGNSSLKFTIPSQSPANTSGAYFTNFSDDLGVQFGENQEFFVQWRQRFSRTMLSTRYRNGNGFKLAIVGTGDQRKRSYGSCTALEVVANTYYQEGFPILYNSCTGSTSHGPYDPFFERLPPYDFKLQNARPAPYCLYSQKRTSSFFQPAGNCFGYLPDEWMTFQIRIKTGRRVTDEFAGSYVSLWIARENRPSQLVIDWGPYNLTAGSPAENQRFGKVWLLPYHTGKDALENHPVAFTWYDELIISRSRIADPTSVQRAQYGK